MKEISSSAAVKFVRVTKQTVLSFLEQARARIVIAKAGYFVDEIEKLLKLVNDKQVKCKVYVDTNEQSIRYGFGEQAALELLNEKFSILEVQSANFIRMAIIGLGLAAAAVRNFTLSIAWKGFSRLARLRVPPHA